MRGTLAHAVGIAEDDYTLSVDDVLKRVTEHFQRQRNVALRRVKFEERRQQEVESFDEFYVALKELADDAELCYSCLDFRLVTRITSGVRDQGLRRKLLAIDPPPSLPDALRLCRSEESACNTATDLTSATKTVRSVTHRKQRQRSASRHCAKESGDRCGGCGSEPHPNGRQKQCKAWGKQCSVCGITGHFGKVCRRKDSKRGDSDVTPARHTDVRAARSLRIRDVRLGVPDRRAPKVLIGIASTEVPLGGHSRL